MTTETALGRVGIILGLEVSRLARNGRDWHHLVDLCALTGALVILLLIVNLLVLDVLNLARLTAIENAAT